MHVHMFKAVVGLGEPHHTPLFKTSLVLKEYSRRELYSL